LQTQYAQLTREEQQDVVTLAHEIGDSGLALQYYVVAEKNLDQARALAGA
jgi:hypothetical protein